jgi:hypothetical protein
VPERQRSVRTGTAGLSGAAQSGGGEGAGGTPLHLVLFLERNPQEVVVFNYRKNLAAEPRPRAKRMRCAYERGIDKVTDNSELYIYACDNPSCLDMKKEFEAAPPVIQAKLAKPITCVRCGAHVKLMRVERWFRSR